MHEFDITMNSHSMDDLTDNERWTVEKQMKGLVSIAWQVLYVLEITDPKTTDRFGNYDWFSIQETDAKPVMEALCAECDISTFARHFAHKANLSYFRGALISGKVHRTDRTLTRWGLGTVVGEAIGSSSQETPSEADIASFHRTNAEEAMKALHFYDEVTGAGERPHGHD